VSGESSVSAGTGTVTATTGEEGSFPKQREGDSALAARLKKLVIDGARRSQDREKKERPREKDREEESWWNEKRWDHYLRFWRSSIAWIKADGPSSLPAPVPASLCRNLPTASPSSTPAGTVSLNREVKQGITEEREKERLFERMVKAYKDYWNRFEASSPPIGTGVGTKGHIGGSLNGSGPVLRKGSQKKEKEGCFVC